MVRIFWLFLLVFFLGAVASRVTFSKPLDIDVVEETDYIPDDTKHVTCWVVTHTSFGADDNRQYEKYRGYVLKSGEVNFYDDFVDKKVDLTYNPPSKRMNMNECEYDGPR